MRRTSIWCGGDAVAAAVHERAGLLDRDRRAVGGGVRGGLCHGSEVSGRLKMVRRDKSLEVASLGPHLFPGREDSAGRSKPFPHLPVLRQPQVCRARCPRCHLAWGTSGLSRRGSMIARISARAYPSPEAHGMRAERRGPVNQIAGPLSNNWGLNRTHHDQTQSNALTSQRRRAPGAAIRGFVRNRLPGGKAV